MPENCKSHPQHTQSPSDIFLLEEGKNSTAITELLPRWDCGGKCGQVHVWSNNTHYVNYHLITFDQYEEGRLWTCCFRVERLLNPEFKIDETCVLGASSSYTMLCLAVPLGQASLIRSSCQSTYGTKNIARADGFSNISALSPYCCAVVPGVQAQAFTETAGLATKCHKNFLIPLNSKP